LVVTDEHNALDNTAIPVVDNTLEHHDIDDTISLEADKEQQDEEARKSPSPDVTIYHSDDASPQDVTKDQHDIEFIPEVSDDIRKDTLPSTSIHVLEKISDAAEAQEGDTTATSRPIFTDVLELEAQTQTHSAEVEIIAEDANNVPARVAPIQHHEIPISKNVQHDLDLWARIREYDKRMAEEGFTQVLSKKQQKEAKKQVLGKAMYNTRAKGTHPPSSS
jgi:hypothetical protein